MSLSRPRSLATDNDAQRAYELDRRHIFHTWSAQNELDPMVFVRAEGSFLWDGDGRRYLDSSSQLVNVNLGHNHPRIIDAIQRQTRLVSTIAPAHAVPVRGQAAALIADHTPGDLNRIFFTNGGAEANEYAIRMARLFTGRPKIMSMYRSYHGGTGTAVNMSGDPRRWLNDQGTAGTLRFWGPFLYRTAFHSTTLEEESSRALQHLEDMVRFEGPETIAAIIIEPIPGTSGVLVPPPGYVRGVREICDRYGIVLIADEVMTGFGRTGRWFAIDADGVTPDLLTFAKGVNSGYIPLGGVAVGGAIEEYFGSHVFPGGLTYSGHPLASAAAVGNIEAMEDELIVENAARLGENVIGPRLQEIADRHPSVGEARGRGVMWALDIVSDPTTREPIAPLGGTSEPLQKVATFLRSQGILPFVYHNRIHLAPPLNTADDDVIRLLDATDEALAITDSYVH